MTNTQFTRMLAGAAFAVALMASSGLEAAPKMQWTLKAGDLYKLTFASKVSDATGTRECKFEAILKVKKIKDKRAEGQMTLTKLYAIKSMSGSGARADKDTLSEFKIKFWLSPNGELTTNPRDVGKIEKKLEDTLEDIALKSHFTRLSFKLPAPDAKKDAKKDAQKDAKKTWSMYVGGVTFDITNSQEKSLVTMTGKVKKPTDSSVTTSGSLKAVFDTSKGYLVSLDEKAVRKRSSGTVIKSETKEVHERSMKFQKLKKADLDD